jgi:hypothetical protein
MSDDFLEHSRVCGRAAALRTAAFACLIVCVAGTGSAGRLAATEAPEPQPKETPAATVATAPAKSPVATAPTKASPATAPVPTSTGVGQPRPVVATAPAGAPASPAREPAPPALNFSDDDLAKYHKPAPAEDEEAGLGEEMEGAAAATQGVRTSPTVPGATVPGATGSTGPAAAKPTAPAKPPASAKPRATPPPNGFVPEHAPLVRTPLVIAPPPGSDPLKASRDRQAHEQFRAGQLQALRDRIAPLQARLDYLNARRAAVLNPLQIPPRPQSDDDKSREATLKPKELLDQIDAEIKSVGDELKVAQDDLVEFETRFGGADGP